jgi:hypothetical protein
MNTEFNRILDEFMSKMVTSFPEQPKLAGYYRAFKVAKLYNAELPLQIFMGGCMSFKEEISTRNEYFFKTRKTFVTGCSKCSSFGEDTGLVEYWERISETTKNSIWEYVQTLFVLGEMFINNEGLVDKTKDIYHNISMNEMSRFQNDAITDFSDDFLKKIK